MWRAFCDAVCARGVECFPGDGTAAECTGACLSELGAVPCDGNEDAVEACVADTATLPCDALELGRLPDSCIYICAGNDLCRDVQCDDANTCTEDACDPADSKCVHTPVQDDVECDFDGLPGVCTLGECESELCKGVDCDDANPCTADACQPTDGACVNTAVEDGAFCEEGYCQDGVCQPIASVFPCTEQGIRDAIAAGGGPHGFDCESPTPVKTTSEILIDNDVILDGLGRLTVDGNERHRVLSVAEGVTAELRRLGIRGGRTTEEEGAGIENDGTLTLTRSSISDNRTSNNAGGVLNRGVLTVMDSTLSANFAEGAGGAILNGPTGTLTMINSEVSGNEAYGTGGISNWGVAVLDRSTIFGNSAENVGGIDSVFETATLTLTDSIVSGNFGNLSAGGLSMVNTASLTRTVVSENTGGLAGGIVAGNDATLTLIDCAVSNNGGQSESGAGGIFVDYGGALMLIESTVSENVAENGGGLRSSFATSMLADSTISGNFALNRGGGILAEGALTLIGSTVSNNDAYSGGGIYLSDGVMSSTNSTVSTNSASGDGGLGGGIFISPSSSLELANATFSGNDAVIAGGTLYTEGAVTLRNTVLQGACEAVEEIRTLGYNIESPGNTCGFDPARGDVVGISVDALNLGPLRENGGATATHALRREPLSVAVDVIPVEECEDTEGQPLDSDQRGEIRPQEGGCDVGAFELRQ